MEGPSGFPTLLGPLVDSGLARINWSDLVISFPRTGSKIFLCHCQYPKDVFKYLGAEMHVLAPDELTTFSPEIYKFLRSRVRMAGIQLPEKYKGQFPRILAASNPGNVGHNFVKATFIEPAPAGEIWRAPAEDGGMLRQFIPARLQDNPSIESPEEYRQRLSGIGDPALVKAMEDGDWDIVAGGMFDDLWNAKTQHRHVFPSALLTPRDIPKSWTIDRAMDWGSSHPFAVAWWAETDGTEVTLRDGKKKAWPRGTLLRLGEWYGWNGKENEGCRLGPGEVAKGVLEREKAMGIAGRVQAGPADSSIFDADDGDSIADKFARAGVKWERADKSPGSRKNGAEDIRERLRANLTGEGKGLVFLDTCRFGIKLLPTLPRDPNKPDDVDTKAEDHDYDMTRYRCMFQRRRSTAGSLPFGGG
jgi:hypothetical protein